MTAKQTEFIKSLATQKNLDGLSGVQRTYVAGLVDGTVAEPDVKQASRVIDALLALPDAEPVAETSTTATPVDVPEGRYAIVADDGTIKFYKVDRPTEGRWAGWTFVKVQASDDWYPVKERAAKAAILATIADDPTAAMVRYGHEIGACGRCGRTLTDETSREMGIGPECAKILGIDRTPYSERARRDAVARVTGGDGPEEDGPSPLAILDPMPVAPSSDNFVDQQRDLAAAQDVAGDEVDDQRERGEWQPDDRADQADTVEETERYRLVRAAANARTGSRLGWRERKALIANQQAGREQLARTTCSQLMELPGTEWEHIFGMEVGA